MATHKRVRCFCHGVLGLSPAYRSPWEDVWLRWKGRPGRVFQAGLTLVCLPELRADLALEETVAREHPEIDCRMTLAMFRAVLFELETRPHVLLWGGSGASTIYTRASGIDRAEAAGLLQWYLSNYHGLGPVKLVWHRPQRVVLPTGFGGWS